LKAIFRGGLFILRSEFEKYVGRYRIGTKFGGCWGREMR